MEICLFNSEVKPYAKFKNESASKLLSYVINRMTLIQETKTKKYYKVNEVVQSTYGDTFIFINIGDILTIG